jgi:hypothetical protein
MQKNGGANKSKAVETIQSVEEGSHNTDLAIENDSTNAQENQVNNQIWELGNI